MSETAWNTSKEFEDLTPYQKAIYTLAFGIPKGKVTTYSIISEALRGRPFPGGARSVGSALCSNPFAPEVPCHRVLKSGPGKTLPTIGGFHGIPQPNHLTSSTQLHEMLLKKKKLLESEGVKFDSNYHLASAKMLLTKDDWDPRVIEQARKYLAEAKAVKRKHEQVEETGRTKRKVEIKGEIKEEVKGDIQEYAVQIRSRLKLSGTTGEEVRLACRKGQLADHTSGLAPGLAQANLVILPEECADDFQRFCELNPQPCPLLEVTKDGSPYFTEVAKGSDVRTDLPKYRVWRDGKLAEEVTDVLHLWPDAKKEGDSAIKSETEDIRWRAFLLGCSFSFEESLLQANIPVRHLQQDSLTYNGQNKCEPPFTKLSEEPRNVPMYKTNVACKSSGVFQGPLVVSMRPMTPEQAEEAARITGQYPRVHGAPVHAGDPSKLGIDKIDKPDFGDPVTILEGEIPVFWACGVTPQAALMQAKLPIAITHAPGHMLVLDCTNESLKGN